MRLGLLALLLSASALSAPTDVPALNIYEGTVTGYGTNGDGIHWLLVDGVTRRLHPDASHYDLGYGDWVQIACSTSCWIWMFERRSETR